jgi:hypothetical protein
MEGLDLAPSGANFGHEYLFTDVLRRRNARLM